jgi:low-affinity ferrous iron transport protein
MRQQFNTCSHFLREIGELRSRNRSIVRMLRNLTPKKREELLEPLREGREAMSQESHDERKSDSRIKTAFDKVCDHVATAVGSLPSLIIFVIGIGVWLGTGPLLSFRNDWQLYINTAVAVQLTFTSMFLQNVRRRHAESLERTLDSIREADRELEWRLRSLTGDLLPNQCFVIEPPVTSSTERFIDIYAYVVGSGVGVALSTVVVVVWLGVGRVLHWNSNWWLIIGTYTGLVGFVDGFILRNVYFRQSNTLNDHLEALVEKDTEVFSLFNLPMVERISSRDKSSLSYRISNKTVILCAHPLAVIGSLVVVIGLICVATGLLWSETGQLICNTPTMIVEGFLLIVLFQAHNMSNVERRAQFGAVLERRNILKRHMKESNAQDKSATVISLEIDRKG